MPVGSLLVLSSAISDGYNSRDRANCQELKGRFGAFWHHQQVEKESSRCIMSI